MLKDRMDKIYKDLQISQIPWNNVLPPKVLTALVDEQRIKPCKAVDLGCGLGNYTIYLATKGFEMTGIDLSTEAINLARQNAMNLNIKCNFISADLVENKNIVKDKFKFAFDYEVLHHIFPERREKYINNVYNLLEVNATYFSVCFSESDNMFGGKGKYRKTPLGTELYFSSEEELEKLFSPLYKINELKTIDIEGRSGIHKACYALLQK